MKVVEQVELQAQAEVVRFQAVVLVEERLDLHGSKWSLSFSSFFIAFSIFSSSALPTVVSFCCGKSIDIS